MWNWLRCSERFSGVCPEILQRGTHDIGRSESRLGNTEECSSGSISAQNKENNPQVDLDRRGNSLSIHSWGSFL